MIEEMLSDRIRELDIITIKNNESSVSKSSLFVLSYLSRNKKRILEIGTKHGQSTINFAKFSADDAIIYSIDIDQSQDKSEILEYPWSKKIKFIEADTKHFDFKSLGSKFDLIFIDGDHSVKGVINDTLKSIEILNIDGKIIWDDLGDPSVLLGVFSTGVQYAQILSGLGISNGQKIKNYNCINPCLKHIKMEIESII